MSGTLWSSKTICDAHLCLNKRMICPTGRGSDMNLAYLIDWRLLKLNRSQLDNDRDASRRHRSIASAEPLRDLYFIYIQRCVNNMLDFIMENSSSWLLQPLTSEVCYLLVHLILMCRAGLTSITNSTSLPFMGANPLWYVNHF